MDSAILFPEVVEHEAGDRSGGQDSTRNRSSKISLLSPALLPPTAFQSTRDSEGEMRRRQIQSLGEILFFLLLKNG